MLGIAGGVLGGCRARGDAGQAAIEFSRVPKSDQGGRHQHDIIEGRVKGAFPGERIVLYARSGNWWLQPLVSRPFTKVQADSKWTSATHLGTEYAALLVKPGFNRRPRLPHCRTGAVWCVPKQPSKAAAHHHRLPFTSVDTSGGFATPPVAAAAGAPSTTPGTHGRMLMGRYIFVLQR
jgi:hypothetical protein